MKRMSIYELAMCCDTGVCGVNVDPELVRISTVINNLKKMVSLLKDTIYQVNRWHLSIMTR